MESIDTYNEVFGPVHHFIAKCHSNMGRLYQSMKLPERSIDSHKKSISIYKSIFGANHYKTATCYGLLASVLTHDYNYKTQKIFNWAESLYLQSVEIFKTTFGPERYDLEYFYRGLIKLYHEKEYWLGYFYYTDVLNEWRLLQPENIENEEKDEIDNDEIDIDKLVDKIIITYCHYPVLG